MSSFALFLEVRLGHSQSFDIHSLIGWAEWDCGKTPTALLRRVCFSLWETEQRRSCGLQTHPASARGSSAGGPGHSSFEI